MTTDFSSTTRLKITATVLLAASIGTCVEHCGKEIAMERTLKPTISLETYLQLSNLTSEAVNTLKTDLTFNSILNSSQPLIFAGNWEKNEAGFWLPRSGRRAARLPRATERR